MSQVYYHVTCIHAVFQTRVCSLLLRRSTCVHIVSEDIFPQIFWFQFCAAATRVQLLDVHLSKFASSKYVAACVRDAIRQSPMQLTS